ncbi:MAG: hypothetical protein ACRDS0_32045 [Pseudonocardiaceae bacterium]
MGTEIVLGDSVVSGGGQHCLRRFRDPSQRSTGCAGGGLQADGDVGDFRGDRDSTDTHHNEGVVHLSDPSSGHGAVVMLDRPERHAGPVGVSHPMGSRRSPLGWSYFEPVVPVDELLPTDWPPPEPDECPKLVLPPLPNPRPLPLPLPLLLPIPLEVLAKLVPPLLPIPPPLDGGLLLPPAPFGAPLSPPALEGPPPGAAPLVGLPLGTPPPGPPLGTPPLGMLPVPPFWLCWSLASSRASRSSAARSAPD